MKNTIPTYNKNRYGQGYQDAQALLFKTTPTTNWFQRASLKLTSDQYRAGFETGTTDAHIMLAKNPGQPHTPVTAHTDQEMPRYKALFESIDRRWNCLTACGE